MTLSVTFLHLNLVGILFRAPFGFPPSPKAGPGSSQPPFSDALGTLVGYLLLYLALSGYIQELDSWSIGALYAVGSNAQPPSPSQLSVVQSLPSSQAYAVP